MLVIVIEFPRKVIILSEVEGEIMTRIENMAEGTPSGPGTEGTPPGSETGPKSPLAGLTPQERQIVKEALLDKLFPTPESKEAELKRLTPDQINIGLDSWLAQNIKTPELVEEYINLPLAEYRRDPQEKTPGWWPPTETEWTKLDIKDRTVQAAVLAMRHYYDMSNADREASAGKFTAAYQDFAKYALGKKLYTEKDTRIIAVELEMENFDEEKIKEYETDPAKQGQIRDALNRLDFLEQEQVGIQYGRKTYKITPENENDDQLRPPHVLKEEWKKYLKRPKQIDQELEDARKEIIALTSQFFLNRRQVVKKTVEVKVRDLKVVIEKEDREKSAQFGGEPWEKILEDRLLQDTEIPLGSNNPYANKPCEEIIQLITTEGEKLVNEQNAVVLEQANKALEWYFHQARELGILDDLEERFDRRYQELALSLFSRSGVEQDDMEMEVRRGSRNLSLAEAKELIAKESDEHNLNSLTNTAESDASWKQLIRDGVISREGVNRFKGIRKAFVSGAYDQLYDSLSNLHYKRLLTEDLKAKLDQQLAQGTITRQRYDRLLGEVNIQRISGEWDVRKYEGLVKTKLDAEARAAEGKLLYRDRYYLTLTGTTIDEVEKGVNNYLKSLLEGSHVYDVQTILQKLVYLTSAIFSTKDILMKTEALETEVDKALAKIALFAENRGDFFVMNYAAQHLLMDDVFIPLYEKWAGVEGIKKLQATLDMNSGLVAPAMLLFLDPKNRLLFQPAGFKGQGTKNIWAQRILRDKIKEQLAKELVNYQAVDAKQLELMKTELMEQTTWQDFLRKRFTDRSFKFQGTDLKPKDAVNKAESMYEQIAKDIRDNPGNTKEEIEQNLDKLRKAREESVKLRNKYDRLLVEAKSAIETTWQVFNIFGDSARLGAPSIIMDNGDHINIEDETYFYKFIILGAMKKHNDTPAMMRWRAYQWTKNPWQYENGKPYVKTDPKRDGIDKTYFLVKGLEDTGITKEEFQAFMDAAKELRANGYNAVLRRDEQGNPVPGYSFEEIISRNDVRPVRNNFISNYKSSREIFANLTAMREAKKGRQPFIMNILERLDQSGRGKFTTLDSAKIKMGKDEFSLEKLPDEKLKELFEDAITDSFIFHITARQLARWEATFKPEMDSFGDMVCDDKSKSNIKGQFSTDRLYYGSQDIPWGVKRLQYLPEYWMTNKRERIGRAWKLLPFIPLLKSGLAQECDTENLPELIMNVNKEHIDEPGLKQTAAGYKDAQSWRQRGETSVDEQRGETNWSYWDKPTVDSAQILKVVPQLPQKDGKNLHMEDYIKDPDLLKSFRIPYNLKKELVDVTREILKREAPLNVFLEAQLGYNRSAGGSGIGLEMGERMHYRKFQWWLSEEKGDIEHERGTEGGLLVNDDAAQFLKFVTIKNSWSQGMSIFDEAWRQARGTRDAGASDKFPQLAIVS